MGKPKYEKIPIHSKADKRKLTHTRRKRQLLETEKKRLSESLAKINKRAIGQTKINSAMQELKKRNPDFAKVKRVEQMLETEIGDLQASLRKSDRVIRLEKELNSLEGVVAGLPYKIRKSHGENTIKLDRQLLKTIRQMRKRKEGF